MTPPPSRTASRGPAAGEEGSSDDGPDRDHIDGFIDAGMDSLADSPTRLTGEMWNLFFHCEGAPSDKEYIHLEINRADISFYNLIHLKSKFGYSGRDYLFYKKRCGRDVARLEVIDFDHQAESMIRNNEIERKVRLVLTKDQPRDMNVSITPIKRPREQRNHYQPSTEDRIDEYKVWLANLQDEEPDTEFKDDYRDATIKTYHEWLRQRGELSDIKSYVEQPANDVGVLPDEEIHDSSASAKEWPSHARRQKQQGKGGGKKAGRGTLKGFSAATKRIRSGSQKLEIEFSKRLGGPIGDNSRSFVDEVVMFTRKRAPLIGVRSWKDIKQIVKNSIASDIMSRWTFKDTHNPNEKIWAVAKDRYKGWRSTFSATYKAYNTYDERMKQKPEDVDIAEWHYLMLYFGSEKFQKVSNKNSDNRQQQKTKHVMGSKPFSQYSFEKKNQTGEEPDDLTLWMDTHTKDGEWSNPASKEVYDNAVSKICEKELQEERLLSKEEENLVFQSTYKETTGCQSSKLHGHGYLAKYQTRRHLLNAQLQEQARASAAAHQKNVQLEDKVHKLEEQLANEVAERDRIVEECRRQIQEEEEEKRNAFGGALTQKFKEEMLSIIAHQREEASKQNNTETNIPAEVAPTPPPQTSVRRTRISNVKENILQNNNANGTATYISSHQLRSTAKIRARRSELHEGTS